MLLGVIADHHGAEGRTSLLESIAASKLIEQLHLQARVCIKALAHASILDLLPPWLVDIVQKEVGDSVDASAVWDYVHKRLGRLNDEASRAPRGRVCAAEDTGVCVPQWQKTRIVTCVP